MSVQSCPACASSRLKLYPVSRRSRHRYFRCRDCGLVGWVDRDLVVPDPVGLEDISLEFESAWYDTKRMDGTARAWDEVLDRITTALGGTTGRRVYDIGAGDGHFLATARDRGFDIAGNEIVEAAVRIAKSTHGVDLELGDLTTLPRVADNDAVTMWCVLAHVPNPEELLAACRDRLRPGGVLYLQTPHRCTMDRIALSSLGATGGRVNRWIDRRIAGHHWLLHSTASMRASLERLGFVDVEVRPTARYSLQSYSYLVSLGVPQRPARAVGQAIDALLDRGFAPRIVLDVFARKPGHTTPTGSADAARPETRLTNVETNA